MPICHFCDKPLTEQDYEDGNWMDTDNGEVHTNCLIEWQDDEDNRRGDEECDRMRDT